MTTTAARDPSTLAEASEDASADMRSAQAVVTGIAVIAPNGVGVEAYWEATLAGRSGIGLIRRFDASGYPVRLAGEVDGFAETEHVPGRLIPQTDRMTHFALAAAQWAFDDSGVNPADLADYEGSVITANSSGGFEYGQRELENLWRTTPWRVGAYQSIAWFYAANTGQLSIRHKLRGACGVIAAEQAGGLDAIAHARRAIRQGGSLVVTGGTDASLCPWGFITQIPTGRLTRGTDPARGYLPFDAGASGYVPGEGGAIMILESAEFARARGARSYGVIAGHAATFDPPPGSSRPGGLRRAVELALADAGVGPEDIDVVFADAAGVPELDEDEASVLTEVFGPRGVPVTAPKTMTGRLYAGGAPLDVVTALLAIRDGVIPPTVAVTEPRFAGTLDLVVDVPRESPLRRALVLARGYGGFNAAMVVAAEGAGRA
nr:beta-ketoacyl synthase [Actinoallomurus sp.]